MARVPSDLKGRNFTRIAAWSRAELEMLLDLADELKAERARRRELRLLPGRTIGPIFHKPSTRTRVARIAGRFGMEFVAATPAGYEPSAEFVAAATDDARSNGGIVELANDLREAVGGAQAVYADVWTSMGHDDHREERLRALEPNGVDAGLLALADPDAIARCIVSARISVRKSPRTCSTGPAVSPESRPRTACTRRRR